MPAVVAPVVRPTAIVEAEVAIPAVPAAPAVVAASAPVAAVVPPAPPSPVVVVAAMAVPPQVEAIEIGASREEAIAKAGKPTVSVSMYEDDSLVEAMRYEWKGRWLGTIRLSNGKVTKIDTAR